MKITDILLITLLYAAGILLQIFFPLPFFLILLLLPPFVFFALYYRGARLLFFSALILGMLNTSLHQNRFFQKPLTDFLGRTDIIEGTVHDHPSRKNDVTQCILDVKKMGSRRVSGKARLLVRPALRLERTHRIIYTGMIHKSSGPANFGEIDFGLYEERLGLDGTSFIRKKEQILRVEAPPLPFISRLASIIRQDLIRYFESSYSPLQDNFLKALLVGIRTDLPDHIKQVFTDTGTIHILAISGLHIGIITFLCLTFFLSIAVPHRTALILTLSCIILYNLVTGYREPIARSTIMFGLLILCMVFDRDRITLNLWALAGLMILLIHPLSILSVSFQLSFLATAGIIVFTSYLNSLLLTQSRLLLFIRNSFTASLSSQILILPVLFRHFGQFPYIAFAANLAAVPMTAAIITLTAFSYFLYHIFFPASLLLAHLSNFLIALLIRLLSLFSIFKPVPFSHFGFPLLLVYLALVFLLFRRLFFKKEILPDVRVRILAAGGLCLVALVLIIQRPLSFSRRGKNEILLFSIRGRCVLLKTSGKSYVLLDSGSPEDMEKHILPFLKRNRIEKIDTLILSNYTRERSGGALLLLKTLPVGCLMDSGHVSRLFLQERVLELLAEKKIPYRIVVAGDRFISGGMEFLVLNPPASYFRSLFGPEEEIPDNSLVLKVRSKDQSVLFCSDIRHRALRFLTSVQGLKLRSTFINPPDFSSGQWSAAGLLQICRPQYVLVNRNFAPWEGKDLSFAGHVFSVFRIIPYYTQKKGSVRIGLEPSPSISTSRL